MTREEAIAIFRGFKFLPREMEAVDMAIKALEQGHCEMTAEEYRQRMIQAFHNADTGELIALCVLPTEKEFEYLEWLLKNHYKKEPYDDWHDVPSDEMTLGQARQAVKDLRKKLAEYLWQNPSEDAISREKAIRWVKTECNPYGKPTLDFESGKKVIKHLEQMSSVTPQPKIGQWIFKNDNITIPTGYYQCSECEKGKLLFKSNYCPNCGRKMIQEVEE